MKTFYLPDLGEGLAEAEIRQWHVKVGDAVSVDQPLVAMETAKAVVDVPAPYAGKIAILHGEVNEIVKTGSPLVSFECVENATDPGSVVGKLENSATEWRECVTTHIAVTTRERIDVKIMPAARILASEMHIDLNQVTPSGPNGLITVQDIKRCLVSQATTEQHEPYEALHGVRRFMAETMIKAHRDIVPVTIFDDVDWSVKSNRDLTVSVIQAIVKAAALEPALNAWFDGGNLKKRCFKVVHLGLAVDTSEGLFVPVIKHAEQQTAADLRKKIDHYKVAVTERSIQANEMQGATITLSNFGMIAGRYATPIIVPPMVAIVGVGRLRSVPVVSHNQLVVGYSLPLSLTFDHRAVTGGEATRFLGAVIQALSI